VPAAKRWAGSRIEAEKAAANADGAGTVRRAVVAYIEMRKARSADAGRDAELRLAHHVLGTPLAATAPPSLTEAVLGQWRTSLQRGGHGVIDDATPLAPATVARLLNDVRAALAGAARKAKLDRELASVIKAAMKAPEAPNRAHRSRFCLMPMSGACAMRRAPATTTSAI